jgi:hypothetical protein
MSSKIFKVYVSLDKHYALEIIFRVSIWMCMKCIFKSICLKR